MVWDPSSYLTFSVERLRSGLDLLGRIPSTRPDVVVDVGCGAGSLTALLAERWPGADVSGFDTSAEMVDRANRDHPGIRFSIDDIATWEPRAPVDVLYSNAVLHWLDGHDTLIPRLMSYLAPGGVLAIQMPDNWREPTHRIPAEILDEGGWPAEARSALLRDRLAPPTDYLRWLVPAEVDLWRTTYFQHLTGDDPVWTWVTGTVVRPVLAELGADDAERFSRLCARRYREAYPADASGTTVLPFSRLFIVALAPR